MVLAVNCVLVELYPISVWSDPKFFFDYLKSNILYQAVFGNYSFKFNSMLQKNLMTLLELFSWSKKYLLHMNSDLFHLMMNDIV